MFIACRLSKLGYFNGDPQKVLDAPINVVFSIMDYEKFDNDYQSMYQKLNSED